jgi:uncharacterized protein with NRDE domain
VVVCLIVVLSRREPDRPLLVAANRDEKTDRDAVAATVLRAAGPRVLGGRDLVAGGTWLAVNEHGVVAGLTNRPSPGGRDPTKRSRGELPLALATHTSAAAAVEEFLGRFSPRDFNLAWLVVGDRTSLYYLEMREDEVAAETLGPGTYVLGNGPLHESSPKTDLVRQRLGALEGPGHDGAHAVLASILADHTIPEAVAAAPEPTERPKELAAPCVHTEGYGTRSAALIEVAPEGRPHLWVADGPPCTSVLLSVDWLWSHDGGDPPA